ncbi:hypothetical protein BOX15_Mlig029986g1, partial [Macrostomum lignano]
AMATEAISAAAEVASAPSLKTPDTVVEQDNDTDNDQDRRWTRREDLALASAVDRVGDRAWTSVARLVAPLAECQGGQPSARACAKRYAELVDELSHVTEDDDDAAAKSLVQRLSRERVVQLRQLIDSVAERYRLAAASEAAAAAAAPVQRRVSGGLFVVSDAELADLAATPSATSTASGGRRGRPRKSVEPPPPQQQQQEEDQPISPLAGSGFHELSSRKSDIGMDESAPDSLSASLNASSVSMMSTLVPAAAAAAAAIADSSGGAAALQAVETKASTTPAVSAASGTAAPSAAPPAVPAAAVGKEFVDSPEPSDAKAVKHWRKQILSVLRTAMSHKHGSVFLHPVTDDIAPGYNKVVLRPMDLTTLKRQVDAGEVTSTRQFLSRLYLIFFNAVMYNNADQPVHSMALEIWADTCVSVDEMLGRIDGGLSAGGGVGIGGGAGGSDGGGDLGLGEGGSEAGDSASQSHLAKALRHHHARRSEQLQHQQLHQLQQQHHHVVQLQHSQSHGSAGDVAPTADDLSQFQRRRTASHSSSSAVTTDDQPGPGPSASGSRTSSGAAGGQPVSKKRRL